MIFPFPTLPDLSVAMFLGRWPSYPDPMWNFGWSAPSSTPHQTSVPPGQFGGGDPTQAQAQAQINALQQQNALLNQQLHNQSLMHINHLQQLLLHHQVQQPPTRTPPSVQHHRQHLYQVHLNNLLSRWQHQAHQFLNQHSTLKRCSTR